MEVKLSESLIVALSEKGMIEDSHNKCTVSTKGLVFDNPNSESILIPWNRLSIL